ncbi:glycolipid transfer protein [Dendrothele bispora CBS 962.96]|uniref:Glycolipid transfer protein n=1 Tax=Dendrothele bispora (strain CBS 962.96) TaxID=1314807 RepID=A0A4S8MLL2_DENBC|nr:glycolipid transfer protein [Dendrothele bispora CBS 962.96]
MAPYFETVKSFADIPISDGIDTKSFLEASDGLVMMFSLFGSQVFGFVQSDIRNNINGVRNRYQSSEECSRTLESLAENEAKEPRRDGTACLVRLIRGLSLTCQALQNMQRDKSAELHVCFKKSYDSVLKHHHTFIIRSVVYVAIRAVPNRRDFYDKIAQGGSQEKLDEELCRWLEALDVIVNRMSSFLENKGFGRV